MDEDPEVGMKTPTSSEPLARRSAGRYGRRMRSWLPNAINGRVVGVFFSVSASGLAGGKVCTEALNYTNRAA